MKKLLIIAVLLVAASCTEEPGIQYGCQTGIPKANPAAGRVLIRCCTQEEHNAGSNIHIGGISGFTNYSQVQWQPVSDCSQCK